MYDRMLDRQNRPTFDDMTAYCGKGMELFVRINEWLSNACMTPEDIEEHLLEIFGWAVTHRKKKKLVCNVFAENDAFTVMLRLSNEQFHLVYDQVEKETQECIDNKYPCGNGGWIHYRVTSEAHFCDIQKMLEMKCTS